MALSGSTRMQASTVLMAAIGFAMKHSSHSQRIEEDFQTWRKWALDSVDWLQLERFVRAESEVYEANEFVLYNTGPYAITVLTDTTERSPTFTLTPFERSGEHEPPSLCYLTIPNSADAGQAWRNLLGREPRPLEWGELRNLTNAEALLKFDFSQKGIQERLKRLQGAKQHKFQIERERGDMVWQFRDQTWRIPIPKEIDAFGENLLLKLLLNTHSTLLMGRLGRYADNVMTYVSANNFKLIDRSVRYALLLLQNRFGLAPAYREVAKRLLIEKEHLNPNEPIVLKTVDYFVKHSNP